MSNFLDAAGSLWTKSYPRLEYNFLNNSEIMKGSNFKSSSTFRPTSAQGNLFSGRPSCFNVFQSFLGFAAFSFSFFSKYAFFFFLTKF